MTCPPTHAMIVIAEASASTTPHGVGSIPATAANGSDRGSAMFVQARALLGVVLDKYCFV